MQRLCAMLGLATVALSSGCQLYLTGAYNLLSEPKYAIQEFRYVRQARALARESLERRMTRASVSEDFAAGYIDGFADYLIAGQTTDPRPTPPKRYLKTSVFTPEKLAAVEEYYAGFRAGAIDAEASGLRQRMIIPVMMSGNSLTPGSCCPTMDGAPPAPLESLPAPREIKPEKLPQPPLGLSTPAAARGD